ncbi:MAG: response regulator, partial [Gammaproteobacteria bacterium]|nr:response regulator [Gammaproteobacteria bacterium]
MSPQLQSTKQPGYQNHAFTTNGKRILVVEDDPDISHLLEIHLQDNAYKVDVVNNGIDGLNRASNHSYALIVLDLMLPGLDGLEVCRLLRSQSITVPILMLTAKSSELDRVLGLELGADDYL